MRALLMVFMIAGMMSTVGVYAAGLGGSPTVKSIGGTGSTTVAAPTDGATTVTVDWTFDGSNDVNGAVVSWTPASSTTYDITVTAGGSSGSMTTPTTSAGVARTTDTVSFTPVSADLVSTAEVVISEN